MREDFETIFVLGGCRSGKSSYAQILAEEASKSKRYYFATCVPHDAEMQNRVDRHMEDRDDTWQTIEEPLEIAERIIVESRDAEVILVDCLTLWITNLLMENMSDEKIIEEAEKLAKSLEKAESPVILVSNEVGAGIVPENSLARRFRDLAGKVNQIIAASSDTVYFTAAGIPLKIKGEGCNP